MKVSIIIPVYNVQDYILKCLESVAGQTFQQDVECLIIDDCGQDNSISIAADFIDKYNGNILFKIIKRDNNGGLSAARNTGLDNATGDYIYFLDSDDWIEAEVIETIIDNMKSGISMLSFGYIKETIDENEIYTLRPNIISVNFSSTIDKVQFLYENYLNFAHGYSVWNRAYKKDIIDKYHLRFEDNKKVWAEDVCFNTCFLLVANSFKSIDKVLYHYIQRNGSLMSEDAKKNNFGRFAVLSKKVLSFIQIEFPEALRYFPLINFGLMEIEGISNYYKGGFCKNAVSVLPKNERDFYISWLRKVRYNNAVKEILPLYKSLLINVLADWWLGENRIIVFFDRLLLRACLFYKKNIYISNDRLMSAYTSNT